jgi:hypothetical protein
MAIEYPQVVRHNGRSPFRGLLFRECFDGHAIDVLVIGGTLMALAGFANLLG